MGERASLHLVAARGNNGTRVAIFSTAKGASSDTIAAFRVAHSFECHLGLEPLDRLRKTALPIFAVKKIANCPTPRLVYFGLGFALFGTQATLVVRLHCFRSAAFRTAVSKAGLVGFQLKLFTAHDAGFDRKRHQVDDKTSRTHQLSCPFASRYGKLFCPGSEQAMINAHLSVPPMEGKDADHTTESLDC